MKYKMVRLGDVCHLVNGYAFKSKDFKESGVPVIKIANVKPNKMLLENLQYVSESVAEKAERARVLKGDVLLTMTGNRIDGSPDSWVGKSCIFRETGKYVLNQRLCIVRADETIIDNTYLSYVLSSWSSQLYFIKRATSSGGQANISPTIIGDLEIPCPDMLTQKKIAYVLDCLDEEARTNDVINKNLEQQAFSFFEHLLNHAVSERRVSEIAYVNKTRSLAKGQEACYVGMADLSTSGCFPDNWSRATYNGGIKFTNGDTVIARITPCLENGKTAYINFLPVGEVGFGSTEFVVLTPKTGIPPEFLYCLARNEDFRSFAIKNMNGSSGRQRVSGTTIGTYCLRMPDAENLKKFSAFVKPLFEQILCNGNQNRMLISLRDTLLPRLISGELDVSEIVI